MTITVGAGTEPGDSGRLKDKFFRFQAQEEALVAKTFGHPVISRYGTTTASESGQLIDLTDELGASAFLADHVYQIILRSRASNDANRWLQTWTQTLLGGATPVLLGSPRLLTASGRISSTAVEYGRCHAQATYAGDTATAVAANSSAGSSLGDNSTNTITLTHPVARITPKYVRGINASSDAVTATEGLHVSGYAAGGSSTTMLLYAMDLATPSADGFDDVGVLDVDFFIVPPPSVFLSMNTAQVEVHVGYDASDLIQHYVDVFIGDGEYLPFGA